MQLKRWRPIMPAHKQCRDTVDCGASPKREAMFRAIAEYNRKKQRKDGGQYQTEASR